MQASPPFPSAAPIDKGRFLGRTRRDAAFVKLPRSFLAPALSICDGEGAGGCKERSVPTTHPHRSRRSCMKKTYPYERRPRPYALGEAQPDGGDASIPSLPFHLPRPYALGEVALNTFLGCQAWRSAFHSAMARKWPPGS